MTEPSRSLIVRCQTGASTRHTNTVQGTGNGAAIRGKGKSQTTCCCPEAYCTQNNRRQDKAYVIVAGSSAYKGWTRPRPVTPCSSSEWMSTSIAGMAVLANQVHSNMVLLHLGSHLPQPQMA